ncbi:MAG TPA: ATP-binding protein [Azospirillum sp.]|nr:ATP-binding protein [Azospirillum sp.]
MNDQSPFVAAERIRLLYRQMPLVLAANVINAALVVTALWDPDRKMQLLGWAGTLALVTVLRAGLWALYRHRRPDEQSMAPWAVGHTVGSAVAGLLWGLTALLFIQSDSPLSLLLIAFVIGGMAAGAVTTLSYHLPAFYSYLLGSLLPLAIRLLLEGDRVSLSMAGMVGVFIIGLVLIARNFNAEVIRRFQLAEEKQTLLVDLERQVCERTEALQTANNRLLKEVAERRRAQDEERRLAAKVALQADQLNGILSATDDHVFMVSNSGTLLYASPSALRDLGVDGASIEGKRWSDLGLPEEEVAALEGMQRQVMETGERVIGEITHPTPEGQRRWEYKFNPMISPDGRISAMIAVSRDVTERMRTEQALQEARAEAERADQAKSRFLAAASHDLRQPMQSMILFAGALHRYVTDAAGQKMLTMLEQGLGTLKGLLDSLLDVSRLDVNVIEPRIADFPLRRLLEEIIASWMPIAASKGLDLHLGGGCDVQVHSDANLLGRMVRNLVENAVRYTERGSVHLDCRRDGDAVLIEVRDTGIGIAPDQLERIFEEFHQVGNAERDKAHGLGLGLSIVQRLAGILGHPVEVRSELGRGSVFSIRVPLATTYTVEAAAEHTTAVALPNAKLVVLVDDDAIVLLGLRASLEEVGYKTVTAGSAEQALERLATARHPPDLVIADYRLRSGKVGTEAILKIRERFGVPVPGIILTGETGIECAHDAAEHGCDVIHKPVTPRQLNATLDRLLGAEAAQSTP